MRQMPATNHFLMGTLVWGWKLLPTKSCLRCRAVVLCSIFPAAKVASVIWNIHRWHVWDKVNRFCLNKQGNAMSSWRSEAVKNIWKPIACRRFQAIAAGISQAVMAIWERSFMKVFTIVEDIL